MSKLFFDHLVTFEKIDLEIKSTVKVSEEKEELWKLVDEIVHHYVLVCVLENLPHEHHIDFLEKFHSSPYDAGLIEYLNEKTGENIEEVIISRMGILEKEILQMIKDEL